MPENIAISDILGERGLRYKRNVLAVSLVTIVILAGGAMLSDVSIFSVKLTGMKKDNEIIAWSVLSLILFYQWVMLFYYGWFTDWQIWHEKFWTKYNTPARFMIFGIRKGVTYSDLDGHKWEILTVRRVPDAISWQRRQVGPKGSVDNPKGINCVIRWVDYKFIRRRLVFFFIFEFGLALALGLVCLVFALIEIGADP